MDVVEASDADRDGILRLYGQFEQDRLDSGTGPSGFQYIDGEPPWTSELTDEQCKTFVAKQKGIVLGFITVRIPEKSPLKRVKKMGEIDLIVVEEKLRRKGIGTILFQAAIDYMQSKKVTHVLLNVRDNNEPAMSFWGHMGFVKMSEAEFKHRGDRERLLYMVSKIK